MDLRVAIPEARTDDWMSSTTLSSWDVRVPATDGAPLPLLFVDDDLPVDLTNHVADDPPGGAHRATLRLGHQDGSTWQELTKGSQTAGRDRLSDALA